jgi:hypothetical protein
MTMMIQELEAIENKYQGPPPNFGRTFVIQPHKGITAEELLHRIQSIWKAIAKWGTWRDESLGDWPSDAECISNLPDDFRSEIESRPTFSVDAWLGDLHDREWTWWASYTVDGYVKIDLNSQSLPMSTWMLEVVTQFAGGTVLYRGCWIPQDKTLEVAHSNGECS